LERVVIVAPNWLGDAVMALPAIADVRRSRPESTVAVAARESVAPLFRLVGGVDDVVTLPRRGGASLQAFDMAIILPNSFHSALLVARARVPERWGYRTDWRGFLLTRSIRRPVSGVHQIDYYQQLTASLGFLPGPSVPRLELAEDLRDAGRRTLAAAGWDGRSPLAAIAPGAAYGSAKRWPAAAFADLVLGFAEDHVTAVVVGTKADRAAADDVVRHVAGRVRLIDLVDRTDIPTLASVLAECRALVANDSGALHLAAALGVNVAAVFGPTDDRLTAPRSANPKASTAVLTNDTWCRPCGLRECPLDHACMKGVDADDVLVAARTMW
jgi:heptosyltransferase-2